MTQKQLICADFFYPCQSARSLRQAQDTAASSAFYPRRAQASHALNMRLTVGVRRVRL